MDGDKRRRARNTAVEAAVQAGTFIRANLLLEKKVEHKGDVDLVTRVDVEAERMIIDRIRIEFPDDAVLAEEDAGHSWTEDDPGKVRWIVDPLDGTTNFVHRIPHFAVSIAYEVDGNLQIGVVYDPNRDELFEATRGFGARLNGRPIEMSRLEALSGAVLGTGFPYDRKGRAPVYLAYLEAFLRCTQGVRRMGAASLDLAYLACGRLDGFWEFKLKPWDVAAGIVLVEEAGGRVANRTGGPAALDGGEIVASRERVLEEMLEVMRGLPDPLESL